MIEIWKDIDEFLGVFQVSNLGRVRRISGKIKSKNGILKQR